MEPTPNSSPVSQTPGVRRAAFELALVVARQGVKLGALPAFALPPRLRRRLVSAARLTARASAMLPRTLATSLDNLADDLEEMEAALSQREDLGRRLRRDRRKAARQAERQA